jgi:acetyl-CoA C-acetyltransferase
MNVYIASAGFTKIGDHWDKSLVDLAVEAGKKALNKTIPDYIIVANMFSSLSASQEHLGALIADSLGLRGKTAFKVEAACASGAMAVNVAYNLVRKGAAESVLVVGVEKMRDLEPEYVSLALSMAESAEYTQFVGSTFASLNGLLARLYMNQMNVTRDQLSSIPVIDHKNASTAEHAQFRKEITAEMVARSALVADPLRLLDCAPVGDGAAALMIVNDKKASESKKVAKILSSSVSTNIFSFYERDEMLDFSSTRNAFEKALGDSGLSRNKISFAEIHDAFSVAGALSLEAMGFSKRGMACKDATEGKYSLNGELPINTFGGLKARGHPVGATGIYQLAEAYLQLTEQAGMNQVEEAEYAVTHNMGGIDTTSVIHILGRAD